MANDALMSSSDYQTKANCKHLKGSVSRNEESHSPVPNNQTIH